MGPTGAVAKGAVELPSLTIDKENCVLCGVCDVICPFGAFRLKINGEREIPILDLEGLPRFLKNVELDIENCNLCNACAMICPTSAIQIEDLEVKIDMERCITCSWCEDICTRNLIKVSTLMNGEIEMNLSECPGGCAVCLEICPVDAIHEQRGEEPWERTRMTVDDRYCIFCGACANACPVEGVIKVNRWGIHTEEIESAIWDRSQERLLREIKSMGQRLRES